MAGSQKNNFTPLKQENSPSLAQKAAAKTNSVEEFRKYIEVEVLSIIKDLAEKGLTTEDRIQSIARLTLELVQPGMTIEQLYENAVKLDDNYSELAPVVTKIMKSYEENFEKKALKNVHELIKNGKYDEAQNMVKKVLKFKVVN